MLVGSHGVLARPENTAHGAQMIWRKADGECAQRGGGPFLPGLLNPPVTWSQQIIEFVQRRSRETAKRVSYFCRLDQMVGMVSDIAAKREFNWCSNTFLPKRTTDEYINQELARRQGRGLCFISLGSRLESSHAADVFLLYIWPSCHI